MPRGEPVAPELLRYVDAYVEETDLGSALGHDLDSDSNLIVFCRELFAQLFANVLGEPLTGIGPVSAQRANVLRRRNKRAWPEPLGRLVGHFQHFSKIYVDLLGEGYGGGSEARSDFHFDFIPSVLADLYHWAEHANETTLAAAAGETRQRYHDYLSAWEPNGL